MKLLLNVLKTLSILGLHAEKEKKKNSERYLKIFYSLVNLQSEEKKIETTKYWSNESLFFQHGVCKFIFPVNLIGGRCFVTAEDRLL